MPRLRQAHRPADEAERQEYEERLKEEARARGADIVMYGHTHRPALTQEEDLITLNPGSVAYPRQQGRRPSYMVMELESGGKVEISQEWL